MQMFSSLFFFFYFAITPCSVQMTNFSLVT